jgi:hypothetical protein
MPWALTRHAPPRNPAEFTVYKRRQLFERRVIASFHSNNSAVTSGLAVIASDYKKKYGILRVFSPVDRAYS